MTRLFFIQVVEGDRWKALAQGQQKFFSQVEGNRGEILLEDSSLQGGYLSLATNKEWEFVYISPKEILDYPERIEEITEILSNTLDINKDIIVEKIQKTDSDFELIKRKLNQEEIGILCFFSER